MTRKKYYLAAECALLFVAIPYVMFVINTMPPISIGEGHVLPLRRILFPILWVVAIAVWLSWRRRHPGQKLITRIPRDAWKPMLARFAICALLMAGFVILHDPERLLQFPRERTGLWMVVMLLYPLLSVVPQELIYRVYFCDRYQPLFGGGNAMLVASGLAFGYGHLLFNNWVAVAMSAVGGVLFAATYQKTRNFSLLWVEHAIYGQFLFTIGLGWYFYSGAAQMH